MSSRLRLMQSSSKPRPSAPLLITLLIATVIATVVSSLAWGCSASPGTPPQASPATSSAAPDADTSPEPSATGATTMAESPTSAPEWTEIDRLVAEDKVQEALDRVLNTLAGARNHDQPAPWTHALIKAVQLRTALHGYETAVRFLREEPWPTVQPYRAVVGLFYAETLVHYLRVYSWEIGQRERVDAPEGTALDLDQWTRAQLIDDIDRTYLSVWSMRDQWGEASLGVLAPYVEQNDYPARIRGTLRDTVSYLWAGLLSDTSLWPVGSEEAIYKLDREALISGTATITPNDPEGETASMHPLARQSAVLGDLERWHRDHDRPEAAFEARRERLVRLRPHLNQPDDRTAWVADLEQQLDRLGRRFPWWSMGMASLAEMTREDDAPDALSRALAIARQGAEAHPKSAGGARCANLAATLEAPSYQVTAMAVDGANRRSIEVRHKNLARLHFRAYQLDLDQRLDQRLRGGLLPTQQELPNLMRGARPTAEWQASLPATPDLREHRTFVTPPLEERGLYVIVASSRADFREGDNLLQALVFQRSDLVLITRSDENRHDITVRSGTHGTPVHGAEVALVQLDYRKGVNQTVATERTDAEGRVTFTLAVRNHTQHLLLARHGDDRVVGDQRLSAYRPARPRETTQALIYTDRAIYRPGQDVHWKIVAYQRPGASDPADVVGRFTTLAGRTVEVVFRDGNGQDVARATVDTNEYGSASGTFPVPTGRTLGAWSIAADLGGRTSVAIEEYKRPTFDVALDEPTSALRLNRAATLSGHARYYFGLPVTEGDVQWRVTREPRWPPWWRRGDRPSGSWWPRPSGAPQIVATGTSALDADGQFDVSFTPAADERLASIPGTTFHYRIHAEVTDEGGETRSATAGYRLGFVAVEATIEQAPGFFTREAPVTLTVRRTDLQGAPRGGAGTWELFALDQPAETLLPADLPLPAPRLDSEGATATPTPVFQTPGDRLRPRWSPGYNPDQTIDRWPDGRSLAHGSLDTAAHGNDGTATVQLGTLDGGAYRLRYRTRDAFGATFETDHEWTVLGDDTTLALPILLRLEHDSVVAGETARLVVHSGLEDLPMLLEVLRGTELVRRETLRSNGTPHLVAIPVTEADRGGLDVRLTAVRDHQLMSLTESLTVPWDNRDLTLEMASFRDRLRPGTEETWRVTVRGAEGPLAAGAAELLTYMYDKSLDLFASHRPPQLGDWTPTRRRGRPLHANLGVGPRIWTVNRGFGRTPNLRVFQPDRLIFLDGVGIGGPGRGPGGPRMMAMTEAMSSSPMAKRSAPAMAASDSTENALLSAESAEAAPPSPVDADDVAATSPGSTLRTDFAETAFWEPHLTTDGDGAVRFTFTVPDAVTEWNVWVHAITRDLRAKSLLSTTRTAKELLVRPYVPRFLREGDQATIEVVVSNTSDAVLDGKLTFEIIDPDTEASRNVAFGLPENPSAMSFEADAGGSTTLGFPIDVPPGLGPIAFRVVGRAGQWSDGELRPLPVLPGRFHLAQSRFTTLRGGDPDRARQTLRFDDLARDDDPARVDDRLVVTVDGQLFYSVLNAVPYLLDYPYPNIEATLNRFVTTGILSQLFDEVPAVARMAAKLAERDTRLAPFDADDPNRTMALEETPWLRQARGGAAGDGSDPALIRVLDPRVATATREAALAALRRDRNADGGFPWFPGGPSSPWITSYVVHGFGKALEMGVEVPRDLVTDAWRYLETHYRRVLEPTFEDPAPPSSVPARERHWPEVTFLNYVLSMYPDVEWTGGVFTDDDRAIMLDRSFRRWRSHSPLLKGYLALTLARADRPEDARLVFDSVLDSATTTDELGTYWAPEDRAWLWYNDTIEGHAFALRVLTELAPDDPRRDGLVQWLLLNKKLNHWHSTRATAEVLYALTHSLTHQGQLGTREVATVAVGDVNKRFVFEPDAYTGAKNQLVIDGPELDPDTMAEVTVATESDGLMFASATWHFSTETVPAEARGDFFSIERRYFRRDHSSDGFVLRPLEDGAVVAPGDQVEVQVSIRAKHAAEYVHLRDPRAAGFEPESARSGWKWDLGIGWYEEIRDSGTNFFFERLPAGEYTFKYRVRANLAGRFKTAPAVIQSVYAPEFVGYSAGHVLTVEGTRER